MGEARAAPAAPRAPGLDPFGWGNACRAPRCSSFPPQLESSAGENTISIIGTVQLYQPSWQPGSIFCLNPHRGQIVSSCSLPRISWERAEHRILQMLPHGASTAGNTAQGRVALHRVPLTHCTFMGYLGEFSSLGFPGKALEQAHLAFLFFLKTIVEGV